MTDTPTPCPNQACGDGRICSFCHMPNQSCTECHRCPDCTADTPTPEPTCAVELPMHVGTPATWVDAESGMLVCDRHRAQYDERPDLGPYRWEALSDDR